MKNVNFSSIARLFKGPIDKIEKYHLTLIIVLVLGTLIGVVANVNAILSQSPDEAYRLEAEQKSIRTNFDQATIDSINQLRERQERATLTLPPGRNNPFTE